jgi:hypothetical protein
MKCIRKSQLSFNSEEWRPLWLAHFQYIHFSQHSVSMSFVQMDHLLEVSTFLLSTRVHNLVPPPPPKKKINFRK